MHMYFGPRKSVLHKIGFFSFKDFSRGCFLVVTRILKGVFGPDTRVCLSNHADLPPLFYKASFLSCPAFVTPAAGNQIF